MGELRIAVAPGYVGDIKKDNRKLNELVACAEDFSHFLRYWRFRDQERGQVIKLGEHMWPGQVNFADTVKTEKFLYALKARKLGYTTIECAYDAWCARFRDTNGRVHLFSRRQDAAQELLNAVKFGLNGLPVWMQLPYVSQTKIEFELYGGADDTRIVKAYPADEETAVEATCTHGHVDEWARMGNPRAVWQAIEPSMAGSCHIITTGRGPQNWSSAFWRMTMAGDTKFLAFFQHALQRPDRDDDWLEQKRRSMDELQFRQEYAMTWEDALYGGGEFVFRGSDLDLATIDTAGPMNAVEGRKYIKAWDIGRHRDAAVGTVLDCTGEVVDVVHFRRIRGMRFPDLQQIIQNVHRAYPGPTAIETNGPGEAVLENLDIPEHELIRFVTTNKSKSRLLSELQIGFQNEVLKYDARAWPQLDSELRSYTIPDDDIIQDSVMSLGIAYDCVDQARLNLGKARVVSW